MKRFVTRYGDHHHQFLDVLTLQKICRELHEAGIFNLISLVCTHQTDLCKRGCGPDSTVNLLMAGFTPVVLAAIITSDNSVEEHI